MKVIKKILLSVVYLALMGALCFSTYQVSYKLIDYYHGQKTYSDLADQFVTKKDPVATPTAKPEKKEEKKEEKAEEKEKLPDEIPDDGSFPISINFDELIAKNNDVIGWIYLEGTKLNYPVVQGEDNDYYLHRLIDKTYGFGGTIFLDAGCKNNWTSRNNILYGHNMNDGTMFRPILQYKDQKYYDEHPYLYLSTPEQDYRLDVFAGFVTESESETYSLYFNNTDSYEKWLNKMEAKSSITTNYHPSAESRIVMLSTCTYEKDNARYVLLMVMRPIVEAAETAKD